MSDVGIYFQLDLFPVIPDKHLLVVWIQSYPSGFIETNRKYDILVIAT